MHQVSEDAKLHICHVGNHKYINVNFGHATTETSLFLPYEQKQKFIERKDCHNRMLFGQLAKGRCG
jgi:hypothetical protein